MTSKSEIAAMVARLMATYPNYKPADMRLASEVFLEILSDLPGDAVQAAALRYSSEAHEFAPSAGTIRAYAIALLCDAAGIPDAYAAYSEICEMPPSMTASRVEVVDGENIIVHEKRRWSHDLIAAAANEIRWPARFPTNNPTADLPQFLRLYENMSRKYIDSLTRLPAVRKFTDSAASREIISLTKRLEVK